MNIGISSPVDVQHLLSFINKEINSNVQGLGGTSVNRFIVSFLENDHNVTVFTYDRLISSIHTYSDSKLKIIVVPQRSPRWFPDLYLKESRIMKKIMDEEDLDIINAHWSYEFAIPTVLSKHKHIITFRDNIKQILKLNLNIRVIERYVMDLIVRIFSKNVTYNSEYLANAIGIKGEIIPNIIELNGSKPKKYRSNNENKIILFIANGFIKLKNPITALKAFNKIKYEFPNCKLIFIGRGYENNSIQVKKYFKNFNREQIEFKGQMPYYEIEKYLKIADILLHPSYEESFGNTLLEAGSYGIPSIAGINSGAVPWVLDYGKAGILVNVKSVEAVAKGIKTLLTNKDIYETISKNAILNIENRFTTKIVTAQYLYIYKKIINS